MTTKPLAAKQEFIKWMIEDQWVSTVGEIADRAAAIFTDSALRERCEALVEEWRRQTDIDFVDSMRGFIQEGKDSCAAELAAALEGEQQT